MSNVAVKIDGFEYNLKGKEDDEYLSHVVNYAETKMNELKEKNSKLSTSAAAMLTAINFVDEIFKGKNDYNQLFENFEALKKNQEELRAQVEILLKENKELSDNESKLLENLDNLKVDDSSKNLKEENETLIKSCAENKNAKEKLLKENKELRFQLKSSKYKIMDVEQKYFDTQIKLAKAIREKNPLLKINID